MSDALIVVVILVITVVLFVSDRLPLDLVALMSLGALMLTGILTPGEALAGFASSIVMMIAGLFVVGAALQGSGVTTWLGSQLARVGGSTETRLVIVLMVAAAVMSSFMSSTGTVAILLPVVVAIARRAFISPSRLLMPLAFASLLGGMLTLIGTPPNIVVSNALAESGRGPFGFFSFTGPGLIVATVGVLFMAFVGRRLLGGKKTKEGAPESITQAELAGAYGIADEIASLAIGDDSPLCDKSLRDLNLRQRYCVTVIGVRHAAAEGARAERVVPDLILHAGDHIRVQLLAGADLERLCRDEKLERIGAQRDLMLPPEETMAELIIPRRSRFVNRTLRDIGFRTRYRTTVLAVQRGGERLVGETGDVRLQTGDTLLVKGPVKNIRLLAKNPRDFVVLTETSSEGAGVDRRTAIVSVGFTLLMLLLMTLQLVPNVVAVLIAAIGVVLFRCLTTVEAYRRINWESVVVVAGVMPMATALEKTGAMATVVDAMVNTLGQASPLVLMAALFGITSLASQVISNTATTVLVAPIAIKVAVSLSLAPEPFLMTVALAASTAFATPIASPVNMLVLNAGGYRFIDFVKVGIPLQLLLFVVTLLIVPLLFPY